MRCPFFPPNNFRSSNHPKGVFFWETAIAPHKKDAIENQTEFLLTCASTLGGPSAFPGPWKRAGARVPGREEAEVRGLGRGGEARVQRMLQLLWLFSKNRNSKIRPWQVEWTNTRGLPLQCKNMFLPQPYARRVPSAHFEKSSLKKRTQDGSKLQRCQITVPSLGFFFSYAWSGFGLRLGTRF